MRALRTFSLLAALFACSPALAQQWIQVPACGTTPSNVNPSAATITVNASGQVCINGLNGGISVAIPTPLAVNIPQVGAVVSGAYADGAINTLGSRSDAAAGASTTSGSVINYLAGILKNVITPLSITPSPSPLGVAIVSSPANVTVSGSPQNMTVATSPIGVTITSSPVNVTGSFSTTVTSPIGVNIASSPVNVTLVGSPVQVQGTFSATQTGNNITMISGQQIASPTTYGVSPVGSVGAVNAFVTNQPTVVLSGSPVSVGIAGPTPLNVTIAGSPQNMTLTASPVGVAIAGPTPLNVTVGGIISPQNVTLATSPVAVTGSFTVNQTGNNIVMIAGQQIASPTTYGVTPVGSVGAVNAFVTNQPTVVLSGSPVSVGIAGPTPLNVTLAVSPISVVQSQTPQNVTLATSPVQVTFPASPVSVAIVSSPVNVTVANVGSPQSVAITGSPQSVVISATPAYVGLSLQPAASVTAWTATSVAVNLTASALQVASSAAHQLGKIVCDGQSSSWGFVQIFDAATSGAVTLGKTVPKEFLPIAPSSINGFVNPVPGDGFTSGIVVAATTTPQGSAGIGTLVNCSLSYN